MIRVINIKSGIPDYTPAVYIGRKMPGRPGSPLANPFKLERDNWNERCAVLHKYRDWLQEQMESDTPARREIERLALLARNGPLLLLCWCAPRICHGDVVKEFVEQMEGVQK
jgi:uncharacterized protein DUF4326